MDLVKSILVPIDFSDYSKGALKYAVEIAKKFNAKMCLIYVIEPVVYPSDFSMGQVSIPAIDNDAYERSQEELKKLAEQDIDSSIDVDVIIKSGKPFVEINEVVIRIDSREIENNLYSLRSDFINAVAAMLPDLKVESESLYNKWSDYFSRIDIHKDLQKLPEITNLQEKTKLSSRQIFSKYYAVKNQEILLSKYVIPAPFTGYIKSAGLIENSFVTRGQKLFLIEDVHNLEIAVPLLVDEFNQLEFSKNSKVEISSDNTDKVLKARLLRQDPVLDRNSQSLNVYVGFSNYDMVPEYLSGNYVNVKIIGKKLKNVAAVPRHLVNNDSFVYTLEEGKLAREKLNIVAVQKDKLIVANNFNNNLEIVTTILQKPLIGMPIRSMNNSVEVDSTQNNDSIAVN